MSTLRGYYRALHAGGATAPPPPALLPYPTRNLLQWLDTQQGSANFAGNGATWLDLSGNGRHATVPPGWTAPDLVSDPANNLPALYRKTGVKSGYKSRFTVPQTAFVFVVMNIPALPSTEVHFLFDDLDAPGRYGVYTNAGIYKIAKGGSYNNYALNQAGLITLAWDGLLLACNNTDFVGTGIGNPYQQSAGLTYCTVADGAPANTPDAYYHLFLVYGERPTDQEIADLVTAAKSNFSILS